MQSHGTHSSERIEAPFWDGVTEEIPSISIKKFSVPLTLKWWEWEISHPHLESVPSIPGKEPFAGVSFFTSYYKMVLQTLHKFSVLDYLKRPWLILRLFLTFCKSQVDRRLKYPFKIVHGVFCLHQIKSVRENEMQTATSGPPRGSSAVVRLWQRVRKRSRVKWVFVSAIIGSHCGSTQGSSQRINQAKGMNVQEPLHNNWL